MKINIDVNGVDATLDAINDVADVEKLEAAIKKACALVERSAKQKAPKGTGELRRSITSRIETDGKDIAGIVFTALEYAPYVEYGTGLFAEKEGRQTAWSYQDDKGEWHTTSGQKPHPYMRPALQENREEIKRILKEA